MTLSSLSVFATGTQPGTHKSPKPTFLKQRFRAFAGLLTLGAFLIQGSAGAQTTQTVFSENMGGIAVTSNTNVASYSGWQNQGVLTYSGSGSVRTSSPSSTAPTYSSPTPSGGNNVFLTQTTGTNFILSGINTSAFTDVKLSFGMYKHTTTASDMIVEYSTDGSNYTSIPYDGTGGAGWTYKTPATVLPSSASLSIRFRQASATNQMRIDDIKLTGLPVNPTTTGISPATATAGGSSFTITVDGTNFIKGSGNSSNALTSTASSIVTLNGTPSPSSTFVSGTQLSATVPASYISSGGNVVVGVTTNGAAASSNTQILNVSTAPTAITGVATVTDGSFLVLLNGKVSANGEGTDILFEWGLTNSYGNTAGADQGTSTTGNNVDITSTITGLDPNVTYHFRVKAVNSGGVSYGSDASFVSYAYVPGEPIVNNPTVSTLDVALAADANPPGTEYAIFEANLNKYVQASGALGTNPVWLTAAQWGSKTVTGLAGETQYVFGAIARNSAGIKTLAGPNGALMTSSGNAISITGSVPAAFCNAAPSSFDVAFTASGTFTGTFKVQLSDASGNFPNNTT
ncbi:MAG: hypothetical protein EOO16_20095, partial [Chitinophagaceae bacterium]